MNSDRFSLNGSSIQKFGKFQKETRKEIQKYFERLREIWKGSKRDLND